MKGGSFGASVVEGMALGIGAFVGVAITTLVVGTMKKHFPNLPLPDPQSASTVTNPKLP